MEDRGIDANELPKLNFLKKKISLPYIYLSYWLTVPEFVNEMLDKVRDQKTIDDRVVYDVISKIYDDRLKYSWTDEAEDFNYRFALSSIKRLRNVLELNDEPSSSK